MKQTLENQSLNSKRIGLRERRRIELRNTIQEIALHLFLKQGYEQTTIAQIAEEANISQMTFFRYFPTKEDAVLETDNTLIISLLQKRPYNETINQKIENAVLESLEIVSKTDKEILQQRNKLIMGSPELRARLWDIQNTTAIMMADVLANGREQTFRSRVLTASYLIAMSTAVQEWVSEDNTKELDILMREAFSAISPNRLV